MKPLNQAPQGPVQAVKKISIKHARSNLPRNPESAASAWRTVQLQQSRVETPDHNLMSVNAIRLQRPKKVQPASNKYRLARPIKKRIVNRKNNVESQ